MTLFDQNRPQISTNKSLPTSIGLPKASSIVAILITLFFFSACSKQQLDNFSSRVTPLRAYLPISAGATSYYSLDSIIAAPFGQRLDTVHYLVKDVVGDPKLTDKDTVYPVLRYLSPLGDQPSWSYQLTYRLVFEQHTASLIDNENRRFIILTDPVRADYSWEGNRYFTSDLNPGDFYYGWQYTYSLDNTGELLHVHQIDQTNGNPGDFDPSLYQERLFAEMQFKKAVGLYSQAVTHITYQANQNNPGVFGYYEQDSYAVRLQRLNQAPE